MSRTTSLSGLCVDEMAPETLPFVGEVETPLGATEMLLLALAAPVLAESRNLLKNPFFFTLGVTSPPKTPTESVTSLPGDQGIADMAPCRDVL
jgi:hypothetical protein